MRKRTSHRAVLFLALDLLATSMWSAAAPSPASLNSTPQCPTSVQESEIKLQNIPAGWISYVASPMYLHDAAPTDGPPQRKGELADYAHSGNKNETTDTYDLEGTYPDGKWLRCSYGEYAQITLAQRLDDSITRCTFRYRKGQKAGQNDITIRCK